MRWYNPGVVTGLMLALLSFKQVVSRAASASQAASTTPALGASSPAAQQNVDQVARLYSSKSSIATVKMEIVNENGPKALSMKIWSLGDKVLVRIESPQDEAGSHQHDCAEGARVSFAVEYRFHG